MSILNPISAPQPRQLQSRYWSFRNRVLILAESKNARFVHNSMNTMKSAAALLRNGVQSTISAWQHRGVQCLSYLSGIRDERRNRVPRRMEILTGRGRIRISLFVDHSRVLI